MRKNNWLWLAGIGLLVSLNLSAQSYAETALQFTRMQSGGSARVQGLGGAQTSLGGDYSSAYSNPAGLGFFNRNEFTVSPSLKFANSTSDYYLGDSLLSNKKNNQSTFLLPGISLVFHKDFSDVSNSIISGNFSISLNRTNDFNSSFQYQGTNQYSSIINAFIKTADNSNETTSQFSPNGNQYLTTTWLAFQNSLIGDSSVLNGSPKKYFTDATELPYRRNGVPTQSEQIQTSGGQSQISIAYGINVKDKMYFGAGLGITSLRFSSRKKYKEIFDSGPLSELQYNESLDVTGSGINFRIGTILKPVDFIQVGLSIATPTVYTLSDSFVGDMFTNWKNYTYYYKDNGVTKSTVLNKESATTEEIPTSYSLSTPWRFNGGITLLIPKKGFISVDVENLNYGSTSYTSATDGVSFDKDNIEIKNSYKSVLSYRIGGEYRIKNFRIRGGYNYMPDPSSNKQFSTVSDIRSISFGGGYRVARFYVDLAISQTQNSTKYIPYPLNSFRAPLVKSDFSFTNIIFTVGFPF